MQTYFFNYKSKDKQKKNVLLNSVSNEYGRMGYIIVWLFGVPATMLFAIFLIRGH